MVKELSKWSLDYITFFSRAAAWPVSSLAVDPAALQAPFNTLCSDRCSTTSRSYPRATSMASGVDGH
jgi:hypothetical protein